jgi:hypothetical protein
MTIEQAAVFLSASILLSIGAIVLIAMIVIVNNIFHKYWKPITILRFLEYPPTHMGTHDGIENARSGDTKPVSMQKVR